MSHANVCPIHAATAANEMGLSVTSTRCACAYACGCHECHDSTRSRGNDVTEEVAAKSCLCGTNSSATDKTLGMKPRATAYPTISLAHQAEQGRVGADKAETYGDIC